MVQLRLPAIVSHSSPPERHSRQHCILVDDGGLGQFLHPGQAARAVWSRVCFGRFVGWPLSCESIKPILVEPVGLLHRGARLLRIAERGFGESVLTYNSCHLSKIA